MVDKMRERLLAGNIGVGQPAVSLSSVKQSKVAALGQGVVGKTIMAAMIVNDPAIRKAFKRIAWCSVGQLPKILECQKSLFLQLTGEILPAKDGVCVCLFSGK